jgi:hypothetical protein
MTEISPIALLGSKDPARRFSSGLEVDITQTIAGPGLRGWISMRPKAWI